MSHLRTDALQANDRALDVCLALTTAIGRTRTLQDIYDVALDGLDQGLGVSRASILLFDPDGVMRFKAWRQLSGEYRRAVEGHTPWTPDSADPQPIVVADVSSDRSLEAYRGVIDAEGIAAMAFIPLVSLGRVIGKFMLYSEVPRAYNAQELRLATLIASQVAFAVARTVAEGQARRGEERLRFALEAAAMGTWDWDLRTHTVDWSDNLARLHGLPDGTFDGTFGSYEREIHPDDRDAVMASAQRAIADGAPHEIEYRIVAPDGTIRWVEGKGRVEYEDGTPVRMTGICMMVTRRKEAELARLAAAEEASRLKDEFLATLSHELRSPLNVIIGWVDLMATGRLAPEGIPQALDVIRRNAKLQGQLIEDIIEISRVITGKLEMDHLPVLVPDLLEALVNGALPAADAKRIRLTTIVEGDRAPIEGDPKRLHQALSNVLSNAIKFTPDGGQVDVRCRTDADAVRLEIRDSGIGIDPEFLPFVFERFRQADTRVSRRYGGLGLGLAIARHVIDAHHGEIRAHSDGTGLGTTVTIALPRRRVRAAAPATFLPAGAAALAGGDDLRLQDSLVVLVDDQLDSRELIVALLARTGARVVPCDSAAAALAELERVVAGLLVADIAMPDTDGHELIRRIRQRYPDLPAVAISAYARPEDRTRALQSGFDAYCTKPIEPAEFFRAVREVMPRLRPA